MPTADSLREPLPTALRQAPPFLTAFRTEPEPPIWVPVGPLPRPKATPIRGLLAATSSGRATRPRRIAAPRTPAQTGTTASLFRVFRLATRPRGRLPCSTLRKNHFLVGSPNPLL